MNRALPAVLLLLLLAVSPAFGQRFLAPAHSVAEDGEILVSIELRELPDSFLTDIQNGLEKELEYTLELMRPWENWLDEYVIGASVTRTIKYDVIKKEYYVSSIEGRYLYEKTFKESAEALAWLTTLRRIPIGNRRAIAGGSYHFRVSVVSRRLKLPPLLKMIFFFVPEVEFSAETKGARFQLNQPE